MPTYQYQCPSGHIETKYIPLSAHSPIGVCSCGEVAQQLITAPLLVSAQREVRYDSPITGMPITSRAGWQEDMKRHDCVEYDPCMKQDEIRLKEEAWQKLDQQVDQTVAESVSKMTTKQRGELWSAVTEQGASCDVVRSTPNG